MAKRGFFISEKNLYELIYEYIGNETCIKDNQLIDGGNHRHRIGIIKEEKLFHIDVFYRNDNTKTLMEYSGDGQREESKSLVEYIKANIPNPNVPRGQFSAKISNEHMDALVDYLTSIDNVELKYTEDKGINGTIYKFASDVGDNITLTYYATTSRLMFQGTFLILATEVKCFLEPISKNVEQITLDNISKNEKYIEQIIKNNLRNSYDNLNELQQDLIYSSIAQMVYKTPAKDYSVWGFSILKGLEHRIKEVLGKNGVTVYDKKGFTIRKRNITDSSKTDFMPVFIKNNLGKFVVNTSIVPIHGKRI